MIDWQSNYTVDWKIVKINEDTWDDEEDLPGVLTVTISRDCTDSVPLLETSSMEVYTEIMDEFEDGWYRVIANVYQDGSYERHALSTQMYQLNNDEVDYGVVKNTLNGQSVLLPALETSIREGSYLPKGANGANWVYVNLISCLKCPVHLVGDGFTLERYVVFDSGDSILSACWSILDAGRWCMQIDGDGHVYIMEKPTTPDLEIEIGDEGLLLPSVKRSAVKIGVPNRYIARDGEFEEIAENDDPSSPVSYTNLGRWVDAGVDTYPDYLNGESLWAYARRRLEEESTVFRTYDYVREYYPGVYPFSLVRASSMENGFEGDLRVTSQKLELDRAIVVSETSNEEIKLWTAV